MCLSEGRFQFGSTLNSNKPSKLQREHNKSGRFLGLLCTILSRFRTTSTTTT